MKRFLTVAFENDGKYRYQNKHYVFLTVLTIVAKERLDKTYQALVRIYFSLNK